MYVKCRSPAGTTLFEDGRAGFTQDLARDPIPTE